MRYLATLPLLSLFLLLLIIITAHTTIVLAAAKLTPYQSGYQHGLKDANADKLADDSLNHTNAYNQGYIDGWCSTPDHKGQYVGSDSDTGTFDCHGDVSHK